MTAATMTGAASRQRWVVMGVCGCGKSTVGSELARALGVPFVEGDAFHPAANVAKMSAGRALDDEDRAGWLAALAGQLRAAREQDTGLVLSCSALKRRYRDLLRQADPALRFVHLHGPRELIAARLAQRAGHYMPPTLLDSQLRDLEELAPDEAGMASSISHDISLDIALPARQLVERITAATAQG